MPITLFCRQSYAKSRAEQKEFIFFYAETENTSSARLACPRSSRLLSQSYGKTREKPNLFELFRVHRTRNLFRLACPRTSAKPELRKKLVIQKRFWKINANRFSETLARARIRPVIKARQGRTRKWHMFIKNYKKGAIFFAE